MKLKTKKNRKPSQEAVNIFVQIMARSTGKTESQIKKEMEEEWEKHPEVFEIVKKYHKNQNCK